MSKDKDKYIQVERYVRKGPSGPVRVPAHIRRVDCKPTKKG